MISNVRNRCAFVFLAAFFPAAGFAQSITFQYTAYTTAAGSTGMVTLTSGQSLNLETGAAVSSGGDLAWNGSTLTPVGKALAADITSVISSYSGSSGYALVSQMLLQTAVISGFGSSKAFTPAQGDVVGLEDNSGNVGKLLVATLGGGSTGTGSTTPTITAVQNNYSLLTAGLPNYGIAQGSLFIIKGTNLSSVPIGSVTLQSSGGSGIPKTLNGASVSVTVNGTTVTPGIYYAGSTQIAAVLPSNTPVGTGTITVSYGGATSSSAPITVVASALGLDTYYGSGSGLGVATNPTTGALYNYTNSISPGSTIVLWGSGAGSTGDSDTVFTSTPHAVSPLPTIYIGGVQATVLYAGSAGYPGVDQINVTVPSTVSTGCGVSVVAVSGSTVSNTVTLPIMQGGGTCNDPLTGVNGSTLGSLTGKSNYNSGSLFLLQETSPAPTGTESLAFGTFQNVVTTSSSTITGLTSLGSCTLTTASSASSTVTTTSTGLNAGNITVTGPTGSQALSTIPTLTGTYEAELTSGFIPSSGGTFTFTGSGGSQVGPFSVSVAYTSPLVWTNSSAITSVNRSGGQNVTWTGGASGSYVYIGGSSSNSTASASFVCYAPASAGSFNIPSYVLLALPAGTNGSLSLENITTPVSFTATGLDYGTAFAGVVYSITPSYQ